jgi:TRAP-type transport system periplasmic protein
MADKGIRIMKPSAQLSAEFEKIGKQIADEWAQKAGPEGEAILKAFAR